jgi:hypothetical protein
MGTLAEWLHDNAGLGSYAEGSAAGMWDSVEHGRRIEELKRRDTTFKNMFTQLVGRAPDEGELRTMFSQIAPGNAFATSSPDDQNKFRDIVSQFIGDNYQKQAQDVTNQQLQGQQGEANRLADLFRTQGRQAISDTESGLLDYQNRLFEKLRPNLITSLQTQGLLNTGGLNEAMAGAQGDLALASQDSLMNARLQNEQQANAIAYSGAAAPYQFQMGQITNGVPYMQQQAQQSMSNLYQQRLVDQQYQDNLALMNRQQQIQGDSQKSLARIFGENYAASSGQHFMGGGSGGGTGGGGNSYSFGGTSNTSGAGSSAAGGSTQGGSGKGFISSIFSSRTFKKNIDKLSEKEEEALYDKLIEMPLYKWHYKDEADSAKRHLGTMTQEALPEIVTEDGEHLSPVDYFGVLTLALKVQHRRMTKVA